jgi:type 1 fimbriae regulatory protein FimB
MHDRKHLVSAEVEKLIAVTKGTRHETRDRCLLLLWLADRARMKPETDAFFISERRRPLSRKTTWLMIRDYGRLAGLPVEVHPHMLHHACGFALADQGADTRLIQDYLGHRNIQHTVRYTATNPARFERFRGYAAPFSRSSLGQVRDLPWKLSCRLSV